jgi:hypothetical protein
MPDYRITLVRKSCMNSVQNARRRVEYVRAADASEAKAKTIAMSHNRAFFAIDVREQK